MAVTQPAATGPLSGLRVVELATVIMGPYATQLLGDLGADIIKIETGEGDGSRVMGDGPHPELSGMALNLHRNKRSIGLDLKTAGGHEILLRMLDDADVFITNLRSAPLERLHIDYEALKADRPALVYCQAQGFRNDSDEAGRPAYDDIIQALAGFPQLNELAFGQMHFVPSAIVDKVVGMFIAQGVLAALVARGVTGAGQQVEVPMFDAALAFMLVEHLAQAAVPGGAPGYKRALTSHRGPHRTVDGYIAMMPYTDQHWISLFGEVGRKDLLDHPHFADHRSRLANAEEVYGRLAEIVRQRRTDDWLQLCDERGIPASPVPSLTDIVDEPANHRGVLTERRHPVVGTYREIAQPIQFSESGQREHEPAPLRWEHTRQILEETGFSRVAIEGFITAGAARVRDYDPLDLVVPSGAPAPAEAPLYPVESERS